MIYLGSLNHRMTLRLDDELKEKLDKVSAFYHVSPSDYIRQTLAQAFHSFDVAMKITDSMAQNVVESGSNAVIKEGLEYGNVRKADSDNIV